MRQLNIIFLIIIGLLCAGNATAQTNTLITPSCTVAPSAFSVGQQAMALVTISNNNAGSTQKIMVNDAFKLTFDNTIGSVTSFSLPVIVNSATLLPTDFGVALGANNNQIVVTYKGATKTFTAGDSFSLEVAFAAATSIGSGKITLTGPAASRYNAASPKFTVLSVVNFPTGPAGPQGPQGVQGPTGPQGAVGPQGPMGAQGIQGPQGATGATGPQGAKGDTGPMGAQGPKGDTGDPGPQGVAGPAGPQGDPGPMGIQGLKGDTGPQGPAGIGGLSNTIFVSPTTGDTSSDYTTFTPLDGMTATISLDHTAKVIIFSNITVVVAQNNGSFFAGPVFGLFIDGALSQQANPYSYSNPQNIIPTYAIPQVFVTTLDPGVHQIQLQWHIVFSNNETAGISSSNKSMAVLVF